VRYRILGGLDVSTRGRRVDLSAPRDRVVLATLLLEPNRVVPVTRLVDAVWGTAAPTTARAQIQTCVSRLRRIVDDDVIRTEPAGYTVEATPADLDTLAFTQLVAQARAAVADGDLPLAQERFRAALGLWRGPALAGIDSAALVASATALDEQRSAAVEDCFDVELRLGLEGKLVGELTELVERHPLRERLCGQLMTALFRVGRQADALAMYRRTRDVLRSELGLEPGTELQELHQRILAGDPVLHSPPAGPPAAPAPCCLPRDVADFSGRRQEVAELVGAVPDDLDDQGDHVARPMILTVDGMAGIGKTALAVHVAHRVAGRYPGGQLFVDLHAHSDRPPVTSDEALGLLLGQLGVDPARLPAALDERIGRWRSEVASRRILLVLDNAVDTAQVAPLLPGASASLTIVTSRRRLCGLDAVRPVSLDVLSHADAAQLLARTIGARAVADRAATADVAELCGRLPLALRLAAARLTHRPTWTVLDLVDRLGRAEPPPVDLTVEGRSVSAAFGLSYRQLAPPEQRLFRLLGLHPAGTFGVPAAAALADAPLDEADRLLEWLVDAHLVEEPAAGRYRLHDLLREYAAGLAEVDPERTAAQRRLLQYYLHATAAATATWEQPESRDGLDFGPASPWAPALPGRADGQAWLDVEWPNVVAATKLADALGWHRHTCLLTRVLWIYLFLRVLNDISLDLHQRALGAAQALGDVALTAMTHNYLASAYALLGQWWVAVDHLEQALGGRRALADRSGELVTLVNLVGAYCQRGPYQRAIEYGERALTLAATLDIQSARVMTHVGNALRLLGRYDEAVAVQRHAIALTRNTDTFDSGRSLSELGIIRQQLGQHRLAVDHLTRSVALKRQASFHTGACETMSFLGVSLVAVGRAEEGMARLREALAEARRTGERVTVIHCLTNLAGALCSTGDLAAAEALYTEAVEVAEGSRDRYGLARGHAGIARACEAADPDRARRHLRLALVLFEELGTPERHDVAARLAATGR
jgi:DNA-binding SARP family transcriptional activator/tetratricopeptide (TPR) repeat protein